MRLFILAAAALFAAEAVAQPLQAVTLDGRPVLLHDDGTWTFAEAEEGEGIEEITMDLSDPAPPPPPPRPMPPQTLIGGGGAYELTYDASRWSAVPDLVEGDSEFSFQLPYGAGYATTIYEIAPIPIRTMREAVLENARVGMNADVTLKSERYVAVEGGKVLRLEFQAETPEGLSITMINSLHSGARGSLQIVTWSLTSVIDQYRDELIRFHDGLALPKTD